MDVNIYEQNKIIMKFIENTIDAVKPDKFMKDIVFNGNEIIYKDILINYENLYVISVGKAALGMFQNIKPKKIKEKIVVSNVNNQDVIFSSHPFSNENGILVAKWIKKILENAGRNDLILFLISGGSSSMVADFVISLNIANSLFYDLMKSGADIYELNTVRKHLAYLKGGKVIKLTNAKILSFIVSDVIGDDLSTIGSGLTYYDNSTFEDALNILYKYNLDKKYPEVINILKNPEKFGIEETLKKSEFPEDRVFNKIICNNEIALKAAKQYAENLNYYAKNLGTVIKGEAREVSKLIYNKFSELENKSVLIAGGESTVKVKGIGMGGRNQEFVLSLVKYIKENEVIASFGTDGIDGNTDAAGAVADYSVRLRSKNIDLDYYLNNNDSYTFFKKLGTLIYTGNTGTNVMDVAIFIKN